MYDLRLYDESGAEDLADAGVLGRRLSGPERACQRAAYELLLESGSVAGRASGSLFADALTQANSGLDLLSAFSAGADQVLRRLAAEPAPAGEAVVGLFLDAVGVEAGAVRLDVRVVLADGATAATTVVQSVASPA